MAVWKDGKLVVNGQAMDAAKASRDMQKFLDAIDKVVKTHRKCMDTQSTVCDDVGTSAAETRTVTTWCWLLHMLESVVARWPPIEGVVVIWWRWLASRRHQRTAACVNMDLTLSVSTAACANGYFI